MAEGESQRQEESGGPRAHELELLRPDHRRRGDSQAARTELHICGDCRSNLVYPTGWAPATGRHWRVELRCPECEWRGGGVYSQEIVDRFDVVLDDGTETLLADLGHLMRANMEDEVERFVAALRADCILPEDF